MNKEKQQQAKNLYFQTDLPKAQIAALLNISRRSLHYWIKQNNWERLKLSATHLPAMLAENNYLLIAQYQRHLLSEDRIMQPLTHQEANTLYKLALTAKKLKNHSTLNEGMEIFAHLIERVNKKSPELAEQLAPFIEEHIENWASITLGQFKPDDLNDMGYFPSLHEGPHSPDGSRDGNSLSPGEGRGEAFTEQQLDRADIMAWEYEEELKQQLQHFEQKQATILNNPEATNADKEENESIIKHIKAQILKLSEEESVTLPPRRTDCHRE